MTIWVCCLPTVAFFFKLVLIFGSIPRYSVAKPGLRRQARPEFALILSILKLNTVPAASPVRPL
jgi:hypothetical protein